MTPIDPCVDCADALESPDHHLGMLVSMEDGFRTDDTVIKIAFVMKYSTTSRSPPYKGSVARRSIRNALGPTIQLSKIDFEPWVLIPTDDDAGSIYVQEKYTRVLRGVLE
ncbi:conserved hypothetical protein [Histoplasma capsulatum var. duboisii H88]|uniref:Uncharacterized protein n=2 Tax=Ajellomyces capsulatus TaxID=5037 RepID=F0U5U0_AJEC8|nr:conserved hypothetical protein [Histoplasma capsulatum H143]EGC42175.1 conserved hypothetical protein [Histoplasma capsulatum var. duboisii H88]